MKPSEIVLEEVNKLILSLLVGFFWGKGKFFEPISGEVDILFGIFHFCNYILYLHWVDGLTLLAEDILLKEKVIFGWLVAYSRLLCALASDRIFVVDFLGLLQVAL